MEKDCAQYELLPLLHAREYSMHSLDLQPTICFIIDFSDNYAQLKYRGYISGFDLDLKDNWTTTTKGDMFKR